jgi:Arc/MetJ-type ribon-helix-helix transcriptional regulator
MSLTPRIEHQIQEWIERGGYPDADAVVEDALRLLRERKHAALQRGEQPHPEVCP